ncbi:nucleotidyltransferase [candidate division WOR-1 bacterium RIFOXYC2_FULL_37_10]|nr:MAG: nucleotidyltransferase [candidate division WOR-1 bacterium RIFOXYA2_FULL_37_7]OGC33614.1 MAG: nucleotidyltransferase [candidate division WOR-1 bacterium RIFOXYC2_FULL_37_10]
MSKKDILKKIKSKRNYIKRFGVKKVGFFGSYMKGKPRKNSDLDVLVEFDEKTFDNYMDFKFFLENLFKLEIDLVIADSLKPALKPLILKEVIYA